MFGPYEFEAKYSSFPAVVQDELSFLDRISTCFTTPKVERKIISQPLPNQPQDECGIKPFQLSACQFETKILDIWEGVVDYVGEETFVVKFVDVEHELQPIKCLAEFNKSELAKNDLDVLEEGLIIKCEFKESTSLNGESKEYSSVKLIKLPEITEEVFEKARVETERLMERLGISDAKTT